MARADKGESLVCPVLDMSSVSSDVMGDRERGTSP
jgi:hypothetical protein